MGRMKDLHIDLMNELLDDELCSLHNSFVNEVSQAEYPLFLTDGISSAIRDVDTMSHRGKIEIPFSALSDDDLNCIHRYPSTMVPFTI